MSPEDTKFGSVETLQDAEKCAALFKQHRDEIDGVLVTLPNFGDERGPRISLRIWKCPIGQKGGSLGNQCKHQLVPNENLVDIHSNVW